MKTNKFLLANKACKWLAISGIAAALAACGGGGSDTVTTSEVSLTGTAATGNALGGAKITVTCASGTGTATAATNGSYSLSIQGSGPCVLTATSGGITYTSIATSSGNYNIDPLTTLLANYLATQAGTTPDNLLSTTNGKSILSNTSEINAAETAITTLIQNDYGVTLSTSNFLSAPIVPSGFGTQSATDVDLDNLVLTSAGAIGSSGVTSTAISLVDADASNHPYTAPTGASGGT